jgi:hypothetical protein
LAGLSGDFSAAILYLRLSRNKVFRVAGNRPPPSGPLSTAVVRAAAHPLRERERERERQRERERERERDRERQREQYTNLNH